MRTTEQKILLTQSELDARVAAAVDARVAEAVAAALAEGSPATSQGAKLGPAARRLAAPPPAPILGLEVSSGVPGRRKTERTRQSTPLSKKKSAGSTAAIWGEEDAATAGNAPAATSPATELLRDASSGVPGRRKTELTRQSTPLSKKKGAASAATFWDEDDAATAGSAPGVTSPATELLRDASSGVPGRRKTELTEQSTPPRRGAKSAAAAWGEDDAAAGGLADPPLAPGAIRDALSFLPGHRKTPRKGAEHAASLLREGEAAEREELAERAAKEQAPDTRGARVADGSVAGSAVGVPHASGVDEKLAVLKASLRAATPSKGSIVDSVTVDLEREQALLDAELNTGRFSKRAAAIRTANSFATSGRR